MSDASIARADTTADAKKHESQLLQKIWSCMRYIEASTAGECREVDEASLVDDCPKRDPTHTCTTNCDMREVAKHKYVCTGSGNVHACGPNCLDAIENREELVCPLTGLSVSVLYKLTFKSANDDHSSRDAKYSTDGFEIVRTRVKESKGRACGTGSPKRRVAPHLPQNELLKISDSVIRVLLWSDKRKSLFDDVKTRRSRAALKRVSHHLRSRSHNRLPVILTDVQSIFITEMQRTDGWISHTPPCNEARIAHLGRQCVQVQSLMLSNTIRKQIRSPIFQLSCRCQMEYFALGMLYIMRDGITSENDESVVQKDLFLNKYLPNLNGLHVFNFRKSRFTHATTCIKMALMLQHTLKSKFV
ncbi:hypothetical protein CYMTET_35727 [Cymbomonas tetramitiformis]|uniref:Uncharacterized protein n=1 Tax=Cymbomonas tetramitiformis TaxID=36881 RepID=A0AAE0F8T2_9CHLO|nr:hypothetical protein CYMTET_35727 [Cymbomonas tetramitiformis]|eukprot:gene190-330_t